MRIVGGKYRGHGLIAPKGMATRPTTDRARESLFNIIANRVDFDGLRVLDLFAGTGALGLEAISRGAGFGLFVEKSAKARASIGTNIESVRLTDKTKVLNRNATRLGTIGSFEPFDLVFADPPYSKGLGEQAAQTLLEGQWLNPEAVFVLEDNSQAFPASLNGFVLCDQREFGDTSIGIFQLVN